MQNFLIAIQFLTRIPVPYQRNWNDKNIAASLLWYPLVGALIGGLLVLLAYLFSNAENQMLSAAIILCVWVVITGGLHLDGLADSADAWVGSHGNKQRALAIMKDPQAGPIAVIVLVLVLLIKFSALQSLLKQTDYFSILIVLVMGRCVPIFLFLTTPYVREKGLGSAMEKYLQRHYAWTILLMTGVAILFSIGLINGIILMTIVFLVLWGLRYLMLKHIDGMTGDTIGASIEIVEAVILCVVVLL